MARARRSRPLSSRSVTRRGRGIRGPVFPHELPVWKSRAEKFDLLVLTAFAPIDARWHKRLTKLDIAVDEVPKIRARDPDTVNWPDEVVADGPVPLSRLVPAGIDRRGAATRARIVLFRRPLELRAKDPEDLADLVHDVLVHQVATYLGIEPEVVDPELGGLDDEE
ncbi:metallopeptidase family protein [Rhodococcus coprophilus]|uniref:metallopeptidase family protein n=1 Tax=Rhodococcus coprophilus TaxID=38310 RepID=UPI00093238F0|nr:metallopeptidase family protein [Rhodococcus coprophilus]MBM7460106.1 putative Zn-dependent protease with MMP-like domain [Rhodococcus coprophilus]